MGNITISRRRITSSRQDMDMNAQVPQLPLKVPDQEQEHNYRRLPLTTWIRKMDLIIMDCLSRFELFSNNDWNIAINKLEKMMMSGVPYRSKTDENFTNALKEIELLFSIRHDTDAFTECMLSFVRHYANSRRRKAMEEIAFVLTVIIIQPQFNTYQTL
jgi:hypothetical protein